MSVKASLDRKIDHIDLCHTGSVGLHGDPGLFGDVRLLHNAMPELAVSDLDLSVPFLDHHLSTPIMVTGMTGGPARAGEINREIASICESKGIPFGLGSQRIMLKDPSTASTFQVRKTAPDVILVGNLGINQVRDLGVSRAVEIFESVEADYLAVHLNPAMELVQPGSEADSDFRSGYETVARLVDALSGRVIVKECGCGLSPKVIRRLNGVGVRAVDVSGVGGTSWVRVEALRQSEQEASTAFDFDDWGIPTAAATLGAATIDGLHIVASGGIDNGRKAGHALALGADLVGIARPLLQGFLDHGREGAEAVLNRIVTGIKMTLLLTGSPTVDALKQAPRVLGPRLSQWSKMLGVNED